MLSNVKAELVINMTLKVVSDDTIFACDCIRLDFNRVV